MLFNIVARRSAPEMEKMIIFICFCRGGVDTKNVVNKMRRRVKRHAGILVFIFKCF